MQLHCIYCLKSLHESWPDLHQGNRCAICRPHLPLVQSLLAVKSQPIPWQLASRLLIRVPCSSSCQHIHLQSRNAYACLQPKETAWSQCYMSLLSRGLPAGRPLLMISGQGATATVWTPDLLQTLAQGRQVTIFTNKGVGLSTEAEETQASSVAGKHQQLLGLPSLIRPASLVIHTTLQQC